MGRMSQRKVHAGVAPRPVMLMARRLAATVGTARPPPGTGPRLTLAGPNGPVPSDRYPESLNKSVSIVDFDKS
jgi:hypothetical protein